jgi:hypothetical protein
VIENLIQNRDRGPIFDSMLFFVLKVNQACHPVSVDESGAASAGVEALCEGR